MKVSILSTDDIFGGAARAAFNLYKSLNQIGINSQMLVSFKKSADQGVIGPPSKFGKFKAQLAPYLDSIPNRFTLTPNGNLHSPAWYSSSSLKTINRSNVDLVHLHWVQRGFLTIEQISRINKPMVWTLHDMWPFCGTEHYTSGSTRYREGYQRHNREPESSGIDIDRWVWKRKIKAWRRIKDLTVVAPSQWMAACAAESVLFKDRQIEIIPVGLNHVLYRPRDKKMIREILDIPLDKKVILIGAINFFEDSRKGGQFLKEAFELLVQDGHREDYLVYVLGSAKPKYDIDLGLQTNYFGINRDDLSLALLYTACDVFVAPSVQENFSATVFESLSCGTPVVAFNIGGMPDMITHEWNGYLAKPFSIEDLATGIKWILNNPLWSDLSAHARTFVENQCTLEIQANRYKQVYESLLS